MGTHGARFGGIALARTPPVHCATPGCAAPTTGGKPFCGDHYNRLPYPRRLEAELLERDEDLARVRAGGAVDTTSSRAVEALELVEEHGPIAARALAAAIGDLDEADALRFLEALERAGLVAREGSAGAAHREGTRARPPRARASSPAAPTRRPRGARPSVAVVHFEEEALAVSLAMRVLLERYGVDGRGPRSLAQVAAAHGVSRAHVRRLEGAALLALRELAAALLRGPPPRSPRPPHARPAR
jgi:DNA-binding Lrp family transcriptional regulator